MPGVDLAGAVLRRHTAGRSEDGNFYRHPEQPSSRVVIPNFGLTFPVVPQRRQVIRLALPRSLRPTKRPARANARSVRSSGGGGIGTVDRIITTHYPKTGTYGIHSRCRGWSPDFDRQPIRSVLGPVSPAGQA
jgi:hypothetical protein